MVEQRFRYRRRQVPFIPGDKTLLCLLPKGYDPDPLERKMDSIRRSYKKEGYQLLYLPDLINGIDMALQDFFFPGNHGKLPDAESLQERFVEALHLSFKVPVCIRFGLFHFYASTLRIPPDPKPVRQPKPPVAKPGQGAVIDNAVEAVPSPKGDNSSEIRFRVSNSNDNYGGGTYDRQWSIPDLVPHASVRQERTVPVEKPKPAEPAKVEDTYVTLKLSELRKLGIDEKILEQILGAQKKLSRLHITRNGNVILEDYDMEIKMDVLEKCLFFLFIRHPEGIRLKEISDYKKELLDHYMSLSGRDDKQAMEETIARLVEFGNNSVNVLLSRIKTHFSSAIKDSIAENYYVRGKKGDTKRITLDRSLVIWDAIRQ